MARSRSPPSRASRLAAAAAATACALIALHINGAYGQNGWSTNEAGDRERRCDSGLQCVPLRDCPALANLAKQGKRPTSQEVMQLQKAHCGFQGSHPKVCCSQGGVSLSPFGETQVPVKPTTVSPSRPQPQQQPNQELPEAGLRLLPSAENCGPIIEDRIIGGNTTVVMELPWMARLGYRRDGLAAMLDYNCGGSLINNRYVLTAAHCIADENPRLIPVAVRLGEHDASKDIDCSMKNGVQICAPPVVDVDIEKIIKHKDYAGGIGDFKYQNDVALLRLVRPVEFTEAVQPVCLPVDNQEQRRDLSGKRVMVAGWGRTTNGYGGWSSKVLLKVTVPVSQPHECVNAYSNLNLAIAPEKQMCAAEKGKDSCNGDSGGPLTTAGEIGGETRIVQHGVVSFGPSHCATEGVPGVYTRVGFYMPWIVSNLAP